MSVFRRPGRGEEYHYDFRLGGRRFTGRTGKADRREAQAVERQIAAAARREAERAAAEAGAPLTLAAACARWFDEIGQHQAAPATALRDLERLCAIMGAATPLGAITGSDIARAIARRRGENRWGKAGETRRIAPATVNRSLTRRLQAVMGRALIWQEKVQAIDWGAHLLAEPAPAPRQIPRADLAAILAELPEGYRGVAALAQATGLRLAECFIRWDQVDHARGVIHYIGKGGRPGRTALTPRVAAILSACQGHDPEWVFTYACRRRGGKAGKDLRLGERYPVRYEGMKAAFKRAAARAGLPGVTFHKQRHTRLMEIARATRSLKDAKDAGNHASIATTERYYVAALDADLHAAAAAADATFAAATPAKTPARSTCRKATA